MARFQRRHRFELNADVNVVSLIDVMLLLLVIFMITAPMMQGGVEVRLPKAVARPISGTNTVTVTVDRAGRITLDKQTLSYDEFRAAFPILKSKKNPDVVYVRGDQDASYGAVARVLGIVNAAGVRSVGLVTEQVAAP